MVSPYSNKVKEHIYSKPLRNYESNWKFDFIIDKIEGVHHRKWDLRISLSVKSHNGVYSDYGKYLTDNGWGINRIGAKRRMNRSIRDSGIFKKIIKRKLNSLGQYPDSIEIGKIRHLPLETPFR